MVTGSFTINNEEYDGDFNLELTLNSGQTSQPPWNHKGDVYSEILLVDDTLVLVEVTQQDTNTPLIVNYYSKEEVNEEHIRSTLFYIFDLEYNITEVYDFLADNNELSEVYSFNKGLRLYKAQFPFECIISSICSANNSIKRWTSSITQIKEAYGKKVTINNKSGYIFPDEEVFVDIPEADLKEYGVGYRSSYMINSSKMILSDSEFHDTLDKMNYSDAYDKVIELEGVGPKVADCILLYGYHKREAYPVDVWINRITSYLYFDSKRQANNVIVDFGQEKFGQYAGYIQLYLFNYARLSGLMEKIKNI